MAGWSEGGWKNGRRRGVAGKSVQQGGMEEAPENGKEPPHSVHANGVIDWYVCVCVCVCVYIYIYAFSTMIHKEIRVHYTAYLLLRLYICMLKLAFSLWLYSCVTSINWGTVSLTRNFIHLQQVWHRPSRLHTTSTFSGRFPAAFLVSHSVNKRHKKH